MKFKKCHAAIFQKEECGYYNECHPIDPNTNLRFENRQSFYNNRNGQCLSYMGKELYDRIK